MNIIDLFVYSKEYTKDSDLVRLRFTKPSDADLGGYKLYKSYDGITYQEIESYIDAKFNSFSDRSTEDVDGYVQVSFYTVFEDLGKQVFYYIKGVSIYRDEGPVSNVVVVNVTPEKPANLNISNLEDRIKVYWDKDVFIDTNTDIKEYVLYRHTTKVVSSFKVEGSTIYATDIKNNAPVLIFDRIKHSFWFAVAQDDGYINTKDIKVSNISDVRNGDIIPSNMRVIVPTTKTLHRIVPYSTSPDLIEEFDAEIPEEAFYFYSLGLRTNQGVVSEETYNFIYYRNIPKAVPVIRHPINTDIMSTSWYKIRDVLIDRAYYLKDAWDIPYIKDKLYVLKGYVGISHVKIKVWINGAYVFDLLSDSLGNFTLNTYLRLGETFIKFQAVSADGTTYSKNSINYRIRTVQIYSYLSAISDMQYDQPKDLIEEHNKYISLENTPINNFREIYSPFVGFDKLPLESEDTFKKLSVGIYKIYPFVGYLEGIVQLLDVYRRTLSEIVDAVVFENNSNMCTKRTSFSDFVISESSLDRRRYTYYVTSVKDVGGNFIETTPISAVVDNRYEDTFSPLSNILVWDDYEAASHYNVYRSEHVWINNLTGLPILDESDIPENPSVNTQYTEDLENIIKIGECPIPTFVDIYEYDVSKKSTFPDFDFSDLETPTGLMCVLQKNTSAEFEKLKKINFLNIILYVGGDLKLSIFEIQRFINIANNIIPPEYTYFVKVCGDNYVDIYNNQAQRVGGF